MRNQKIMVAGAFDLERILKTIKKKTGKNAEILVMTKKSDAVQTDDDESDKVQIDDEHELVLEKNETSSLVPKQQENLENEKNDDKPETSSVMEVEFKIPFLNDKYEVKKVISKFEGVETCVVDVESQKVVVTGSFDQEKMLKKLKKKMDKKKDEESKIAAGEKEEADMSRDMHVKLNI
ncbi:PREDICTED: heavy metal-associated isoprenylated plant protein 3-like [Camelina sativa]|uniref:Heavy metal-associated isoprenylated plant protein 3-like n=1 Tax=Camelina sativa TaxID=90675 RepID=A0ABM1QMR3_CAMSA|nr:PREDICTED: heavy metal-associated isoprenylated plant protein 3-like [Camelina sativa]